MGNVAVADELAGLGELDELYKLTATETEPENGEEAEDEGEEEHGSPEPEVMGEP